MLARLKLTFSEKFVLYSRDADATYKLLDVFFKYEVMQ